MMTKGEKQRIFDVEYSVYGWGWKDTTKFLSLVGYLHNMMLKGNPSLTITELLDKLTKDSKYSYGGLFEKAEIHLTSMWPFMPTNGPDYDNYGLTNPKDIANEIRNLLSEWLPF